LSMKTITKLTVSVVVFQRWRHDTSS
jgi:hypothetical protein